MAVVGASVVHKHSLFLVQDTHVATLLMEICKSSCAINAASLLTCI